jgi:hypothetical protein
MTISCTPPMLSYEFFYLVLSSSVVCIAYSFLRIPWFLYFSVCTVFTKVSVHYNKIAVPRVFLHECC